MGTWRGGGRGGDNHESGRREGDDSNRACKGVKACEREEGRRRDEGLTVRERGEGRSCDDGSVGKGEEGGEETTMRMEGGDHKREMIMREGIEARARGQGEAEG